MIKLKFSKKLPENYTSVKSKLKLQREVKLRDCSPKMSYLRFQGLTRISKKGVSFFMEGGGGVVLTER